MRQTSWSINTEGIADLSYLKILFAIGQTSLEPGLCEVTGSFASLQQLQVGFNLAVDTAHLYCC